MADDREALRAIEKRNEETRNNPAQAWWRRSRPCLVCEKPCATEGQLCPNCVAAGHRVTDDQVIVNIEINLPDWMDR